MSDSYVDRSAMARHAVQDRIGYQFAGQQRGIGCRWTRAKYGAQSMPYLSDIRGVGSERRLSGHYMVGAPERCTETTSPGESWVGLHVALLHYRPSC